MSVKATGKLLSVDDVANYLGITKATVYQMNYAGQGPKRIRVGKHVRYRDSDLQAWIAAHEVEAVPA